MQYSKELRKVFSQINACRDAFRHVYHQVFISRRPADKSIAAFFRENRQYGSRDRFIINETLFSIMRWWGWVKNFQSAPTESNSTLLLAAMLLEFKEINPPIEVLAEGLGIRIPEKMMELSPQKKMQEYCKLLKWIFAPGTFTDEKLAPEWTYDEMPASINKKKLLESLKKRPPMWLRAQVEDVDSLVVSLTEAGLSAKRHDKIRNAICVENAKVNLYEVEAFKKGKFEVQDISSQCIGLATMAKPGQKWWDACAGAGGKTLQLASMMDGRGIITSTDIREYKLNDLRQRARRADFQNIRTGEWDGKLAVKRRHNLYDGVLVDAPCTSSGRWRRNPDSRWLLAKEDIAEMAELQYTIINNAAPSVKPGGVLLFATCSVFKNENFAVVERFLKDHPEFKLDPFPHPATGKMTDGTLSVMPYELDGDASFSARFIKQA